MSGRRLTSTPAVRASLPRWSGLGRGNLGTLALLIAALALPACVVEPTDEGDVGVELEESADFLEIGVPDVPDELARVAACVCTHAAIFKVAPITTRPRSSAWTSPKRCSICTRRTFAWTNCECSMRHRRLP